MIIGLGNDICHVARIEAVLARFGKRFKQRLFTDYERTYADKQPHHSDIRYAQFFAAKEACAKALGSGIASGIFWRDMEVRHDEQGAPYLQLHGNAEQALLARASAAAEKDKTGAFTPRTHLTLTADASIANAVVILEIIGKN